jgi:6-phosphofructokinase 1
MGIKTIGIPGTIDNDIASSDYTIGFSTALNTACEAIDKLRDTSSSHQRCSIIEVMGRHCGDLALYSGICCGAEYIITNETGLDKEKLLKSLKENRLNGRRHAIVVISENITDVYQLAKEVESYSGYECRATILGYVQRGGTPTPEDRLLAARLGKYAVDLLKEGVTGVAVGVRNNTLVNTPIEKALVMKNEPNAELFDVVNKIS